MPENQMPMQHSRTHLGYVIAFWYILCTYMSFSLFASVVAFFKCILLDNGQYYNNKQLYSCKETIHLRTLWLWLVSRDIRCKAIIFLDATCHFFGTRCTPRVKFSQERMKRLTNMSPFLTFTLSPSLVDRCQYYWLSVLLPLPFLTLICSLTV